MKLRLLLPAAALLALTACGDDAANQTGSTNNANPPPAATSPTTPTPPAPPAPGGTSTPTR